MDAQVQVVGDDTDEEPASLWRWLSDEDDLQGHIRQVPGPADESQLGGAFETIGVGLGSTTACIAFTRCVVAWLKARHLTVMLKVTISPNQTTVEIDGANPEAARTLLEEALGPLR